MRLLVLTLALRGCKKVANYDPSTGDDGIDLTIDPNHRSGVVLGKAVSFDVTETSRVGEPSVLRIRHLSGEDVFTSDSLEITVTEGEAGDREGLSWSYTPTGRTAVSHLSIQCRSPGSGIYRVELVGQAFSDDVEVLDDVQFELTCSEAQLPDDVELAYAWLVGDADGEPGGCVSRDGRRGLDCGPLDALPTPVEEYPSPLDAASDADEAMVVGGWSLPYAIHWDGMDWVDVVPQDYAGVVRHVVVGDGRWVIAGGGGTMYSDDPRAGWTTATGVDPQSMVFGDGVFLGAFPWLARSEDGADWVDVDYGGIGTPNAVGHGDGTWVLFESPTQGVGGGGVFTSPDGLSWTVGTAPVAAYHVEAVAHGAGTFVAVGDGVVLTSPDAQVWTDVTPSGVGGLLTVSWSPGEQAFLATGSGGLVLYSDDGGASWTSLDWQGSGSFLSALAASPG